MSPKTQKSEHEEYLEEELARMQRDQSQQADREYLEREKKRKERQAEADSEYRTAESWPEAFQKQAALCRREVERFPDDSDKYFLKTAEANTAALKIWMEVAGKRQAEIDAIWTAIREEVASRLEAESPDPEYRQVAAVIRDDCLEGYLDW